MIDFIVFRMKIQNNLQTVSIIFTEQNYNHREHCIDDDRVKEALVTVISFHLNGSQLPWTTIDDPFSLFSSIVVYFFFPLLIRDTRIKCLYA